MDARLLLSISAIALILAAALWIAATVAARLTLREDERDPDRLWLLLSPMLHIVRRWLRWRG